MTSIGEERCRKIFENILGEKCLNVRPSWLKNYETGYLLKLDGYSKSLKLAFEYDGIQHHVFPNLFHKNRRQFEKQRRRDEMKDRKCRINKVTRIRIKYDVENVEEFIRQKLKEKKFI